jgi:hypothetical protein
MRNQRQKLEMATPAGFEPATFSLEGRRFLMRVGHWETG